jgi:hypothetical protein
MGAASLPAVVAKPSSWSIPNGSRDEFGGALRGFREPGSRHLLSIIRRLYPESERIRRIARRVNATTTTLPAAVHRRATVKSV